MKKIFIKTGKMAVIGATLIAGTSMAEDVSSLSEGPSSIQAIVETFDSALSLGLTASHEGGSELSRIEADMNRLHKICAKIEATEEQKTVIRDDVFAFKEKTLPLETNLKLARLKYVHTALLANGLEADASARVTDAVNAMTGIAQAKGDLVTKILFQTLKPEQRKPALYCLAAMKLVHKHGGYEDHSID